MENITKFDMSDPIAYYMDVDVEVSCFVSFKHATSMLLACQ